MTDQGWDHASFYAGRSDLELELQLPEFLRDNSAVWSTIEPEIPYVVVSPSLPSIPKKNAMAGAYPKLKRWGSLQGTNALVSMSMPDLKLKHILKHRASEDCITTSRPKPVMSYTEPPLPTNRDFAILNRPVPATPTSDVDSVRAEDFPLPPPSLIFTMPLESRYASLSERIPRRSESYPRLKDHASHPAIGHGSRATIRCRPHSTGDAKINDLRSVTRSPAFDFFYTPWDPTLCAEIARPLENTSIRNDTRSTSTAASSTLFDQLGNPLADILPFPTKATSDPGCTRPIHRKIQSSGMTSFMDMEAEKKPFGASKKLRRAFSRFVKKMKGGGNASD